MGFEVNKPYQQKFAKVVEDQKVKCQNLKDPSDIMNWKLETIAIILDLKVDETNEAGDDHLKAQVDLEDMLKQMIQGFF